ncbi:MAG: thioredoxin family protein [Flavobacteriales bacterium]|nr:thioredoxin family protein [Flavobacteriales bacterium]
MNLKKFLVIPFLFLAMTLSAQATYEITDAVINEGWSNNAEEVFSKAKEKDNPILMNFTGTDWCVWCKKIKKEIFDTDEFRAWVSENNIQLLELDFPRNIPQSKELKAQNASLAREIGVKGYPTIILISKGKMIKTGYVKGGPNAWIKSVESQIEL